MATKPPTSIVIAVAVGAAITAGMLMVVDRPGPAAPAHAALESSSLPIATQPALPTAGEPRLVAATPRPLAVVLSGVATGADQAPLALVSIHRGPVMLLRVGDSMGGSARVLRIDPDSMTYLSAGAELQVSVKPADAAPASATAGAAAKPLAGFVAAAPAIARAEGAQPGSGNAMFRQSVERKRMAIAAGQ